MMEMDGIEHLKAAEHVLKADAALAAAIKAKQALDEQWPDGAESVRYLLAHGTFLDLLQIVNTHANMATAKAMVEMQARHVPVVFSTGMSPRSNLLEDARAKSAAADAISTELAAVRAGLCPIHHVALVDGRCPEDVVHPLKNEHPHGRWEEWRDDGKCIVKSCPVWRESAQQ